MDKELGRGRRQPGALGGACGHLQQREYTGSMANMAFKKDFGVRLTLNTKGKVLDFGHERLIERSCKVEHFFSTYQSSLEILQDSIENSLLKKVYINYYA